MYWHMDVDAYYEVRLSNLHVSLMLHVITLTCNVMINYVHTAVGKTVSSSLGVCF